MPNIEFNKNLNTSFVPMIPDPLQGNYTRKIQIINENNEIVQNEESNVFMIQMFLEQYRNNKK